MKHLIFALISLFFVAFSAQAQSAKAMPTKEIALNAEEKASVTRVEKYLSGLTTILADFVQIAPDGSLVSGKFYLQRPGKMRWQYEPPTPILMVADGRHLIFYDYELDQTSYIPLQDTLAGFLARKDIKFGKDVVITAIEEGAGTLRLTMVQKSKPKDGSLTLEFATEPLQLRNMLVFDATGQQTTVALNNARYGVPLDAKLFIFDDTIKPRIGKKKPSQGISR
ncbi:MAG: outer membrane lipoprotein carrier protein LolA [Alphaproteobacteria bacterium]|nr:outer membrane lipoprotein carrier protein LolA [Alphaproteobacteria bacterium]